MIYTAVSLLVLLVQQSMLQASDKPEKMTPEQQYKKLLRDYEKAIDEDKKATDSDNEFLINSKFTQAFLTLAKSNPKTNAALGALKWITEHTVPSSDPQSPRAQALKIFLRNHVESEKIVSVCQHLQMYVSEADSRKLLRGVLEKNSHRSVRAMACITLVQHAKSNISVARELKEDPAKVKEYGFMGKEYVEALIKAKPEELKKEVEVLYEQMAKDFADVPRIIYYRPDPDAELRAFRSSTLGEYAKAKLAALRHPIVVGKPSPEIEGKDIESRKFKLSNYRGKIVLLVFWGNWSGPCKAMYDYERSLVKRLEGKPFVLIGVNTDFSLTELKKVIKEEKITWRSFMDGGLEAGVVGDGGPISCRWGIESWAEPTLFLIDDKGVIRHKHEGSPGSKALDAEIDKLLEKRKGSGLVEGKREGKRKEKGEGKREKGDSLPNCCSIS